MEQTASLKMSNSQVESEGLTDFKLDENIINIIKTNNKGSINKLKENLIKSDRSSQDVYETIFNTKNNLDNFFTYTFKCKNKFSFIENLLNNFLFEDGFPNSVKLNFLHEVIKIDKGQYLLKKIDYKKILTNLDNDDLIDIYFTSGISSTLPVFLLIDDLIINANKSYTDSISRSILSAACRNADNRILKYIIKNFHRYHIPSWNNINFVKVLVNNLFQGHIPLKYTLRRFKLISTKINLCPYFHFIINYVNDIDTLMIFNKYYNKGFRPEGNNIYHLTDLIDKNVLTSEDDIRLSIIKILSIFSQKSDKMIFLLNVLLRNRTLLGINFLDYVDLKGSSQAIDYVERITDTIFSSHQIEEVYNSYDINDLKSIYSVFQPNLSKYYSINHVSYHNHFLFMMPFVKYYPVVFPYRNLTKHIMNIIKRSTQMNLIKYHLKILLRKNHKINKLENKVKMLKLLEEIKFFKPNKKYNILSKGSYLHRLSLQKFTKLPPRHIVPLELNMIKPTNEGSYLIREKADGCLVDFLSTDVEPVISEYNSNVLKAEFIEELDLYLVFDIKLDDMSIIERYDYIRKLHPSTRHLDSISDSKPIQTFKELKEKIIEERKLFKEFLNKPYKNYRVYPKAAWLVNSMEILNKEIIENIVEENDSDLICENGPYQNDGLIITPLDGSRELKVKPKSMHSIDLLYNGRNWVDREGNLWNHIISNKEKFSPNTIWRCYPKFVKNIDGDYMFEAREYRFDKSKPNTNKVSNMIYKLHSVNWLSLDSNGYKCFYHKDFKLDKKLGFWSNIVETQNKHLSYVLENINPSIKSSWLDLGCGSSKLLKYIKNYNFSDYIGLDIDANQLIAGLKRIDSNQYFLNVARTMPMDLRKEWSTSEISWDIFDNTKKFDYIVSNFSLSHFYNEEFWEKLENVSKENTYFIFNVVNCYSSEKWSNNQSYLYLDKNIVRYYFETVHSSEMTEKYISEEEIYKYFNKFNWEIIEKTTPVGSDLDSKYTWYVVKHK